MNESVAAHLHSRVVDRLNDYHDQPLSRDQVLADYIKKVMGHLVILEEVVQELHHRNAQLSRRLRGLQNRVDVVRRKKG